MSSAHMETSSAPTTPGWRQQAYSIIFEADTPAGRTFDIVLLWAILLSVLVVMLESVHEINALYGPYLRVVEWIFTGLFLLEYILRLSVVRRPLTYAFSLLGIVDFLSVVPTLISLALIGSQYLIVIRTLRLVFLTAVVTLVIIIGTLMYVIEGGQNGFTSIPKSIYWAIVTLTTVGYGDISPTTILGQTLASVLMILGYAIIAVPTGIVSAQMATPRTAPPAFKQMICHVCQATDHKLEAEYCWRCGEKL
jgi:voltage-gated potassium channel